MNMIYKSIAIAAIASILGISALCSCEKGPIEAEDTEINDDTGSPDNDQDEDSTGDEDGSSGDVSGEEGDNNEGNGEGENPEEYFYTEVSSSTEDWSGDYLITYTSGNTITVFNSWDPYGQSTLDMHDYITVDGIPAEYGDPGKSVISKFGSGYSIYVSGVGYIGYTGSKNSLLRNESDQPSAETDVWEIYFDGTVHICPASASGRELMWNNSAPRFACYKSNLEELTLYKRNVSDGNIELPGDGGQNPEPEPDPEPDPDEGGETPGGEISEGGNTAGWLVNMEVPHADVNISGNWSRTVSEKYGNSLAYVCETDDPDRLVVTHTFTDGGEKYRNYTILFDKSKKAALWVAYAMHKNVWGGDSGRNDAWTYDPAIPSDWQSTGCSSPYSKGHQIASNDRQRCVGANKQTFYYSNQTPQWQTRFNDGVWNTLENRVQSNAPSGRDTLYVVTGPIYGSGYKSISDKGGKQVPVPTGYWKCLMKCSFSSSGEMTSASGIGYLFEKNGEYSNTNYSNYSVTIDEIEALTGFDLFANIPEGLQAAAESKKTVLF